MLMGQRNRKASRSLDSPIKRLCHNVILRPEPKNLSLITHRFHEILHGVYPEPKSETLRFTQGDSGEGFRMTNSHFKVIATQSPSRGMTWEDTQLCEDPQKILLDSKSNFKELFCLKNNVQFFS